VVGEMRGASPQNGVYFACGNWIVVVNELPSVVVMVELAINGGPSTQVLDGQIVGE